MHLTDQQIITLKAAILAETNAEFVALRQAGAVGAMAAWYNSASTFRVWRTSVSRDDVTTDGFDWTQVDNLSVGQARIWELLFDNTSRTVNPAEAGKRAGISECWKGTAAKVAVATFVLGRCKRFATRGERLFVTGTGAGTDASPGLLVVEGGMDIEDVVKAVNLP